MLNRILIGLVAAGAAVVGAPGWANADPQPAPPPPPNPQAFAPVQPSAYASPDGVTYAFTVAGGITCTINRGNGGYGCGGPIPGAPDGANMVSGGQHGPAGFATADRMYTGIDGAVKELPKGSRISFRNVSCGTDGSMTVCSNNFDGGGFVISPAGSFIIDPNNPILLNTGEGKNPFTN